MGYPPNPNYPPRSDDSSLAGALGDTPQLPAHIRTNVYANDSHGNNFADDMELDLDSDSSAAPSPPSPQHSLSYSASSSTASSPPDTPLLPTPVSGPSFAWGPGSLADRSACAPLPAGPSAFDTTAVHPPSRHSLHTTLSHPYAPKQAKHPLFSLSSRPTPSWSLSSAALGRALNGYAGYSDYSSGLPGTIGNSSGAGSGSGIASTRDARSESMHEAAIPPALLFSPGSAAASSSGLHSAASTPMTTPGHSRAPSPTVRDQPSAEARPSARAAVAQGSASTTLSRPASNLLLSKPFKCPKPGCMKSYKQANGLKYHMTHG